MGPVNFGTSALVFGDGHAVPTERDETMQRFDAVGEIALRHRPDILICGGDMWDMGSLASWRGSRAVGGAGGGKSHEGRRVGADIGIGKDAMKRIMAPIDAYNKRRSKQGRLHLQYKPRRVFLLGNHEFRLNKVAEYIPELADTINVNMIAGWLQDEGWEVFDGMNETFWFEGVGFQHYFPSGPMGRAVQINTARQHLPRSSVWFHTHQTGSSEVRLGKVVNKYHTCPALLPDHRIRQKENNGALFLSNIRNGDFSTNEISFEHLMTFGQHAEVRHQAA